MGEYLYEDLSKIVIGAAFSVHNALGKGLQEKAYENALTIRLRHLGLEVEQQKQLPVLFEKQKVGDQVIDLVVNKRILVEIKAVSAITSTHISQLLGYLKNTGFQLGLLLNFGNRVTVKRLILTSQNK